MARTRALLTETDRELIKESEAKEKRYQAISRARGRINDELPTDVQILREHHPELFEELRQIVCDIED